MITVLLKRKKEKEHLVKFDALQRYGPLQFVYLSNAADRQLNHPDGLKVTVESCSSAVLENTRRGTIQPQSKEEDNGTGSRA